MQWNKILVIGLALTVICSTDRVNALVIEDDSNVIDNDSLNDPNTRFEMQDKNSPFSPIIGVDVDNIIKDYTDREEGESLGDAILNDNKPSNDSPNNIFTGSTKNTGTILSTAGSNFGVATDSNTYRFISETQIKNNKGNTVSWQTVLSAKETEVSNEVVESSKQNYKVNSISGDLDFSTGDTLWGTKDMYSDLKEFGAKALIRITVNGDDAYILVDNLSGTNLSHTVNGLNQYKDAVKHGVFTGGMVAGFNLYSMYSQYNVLLSEVLDTSGGTTKLKSNANLKYSSDIFFHPIVGKLKIKDIATNTKVNYTKLDDKATLLQLTHATKDKVTFTVHADYKVFNDTTTQERGFFTKVTTSNSSIRGGATEYTSKYNQNKKRALSGLADTTMYLAIPKSYTMETSANSYKLRDNGYDVVKGLKLVAHSQEVYEINGEELVLKGKFSDYGLNPKEMVIYKTTDNGATVGALIPLKYKEVIYNPQDGKKHYTGRTLILSGDFKKNIKLQDENKEVFGIEGDMVTGEKLVNFAFPENSSYKDGASHKEVKDTASVFNIQTEYIKPSNGTGMFGAIIVRNNTFAKDNNLLAWLDTDKAKSMEGVDTELLKKLILGEMKVEKEDLTYAEWVRLQEIKEEMNTSWENKMSGMLYKVLIVGGFILIIYSILFTLLWFIDTIALFTDISLLHIITFGRCYPIESLEYVDSTGYGSQVKYITLKTALMTSTLGAFAGGLFMTVEPVIDFLTWFYLYITDITSKIG